MLPTACGVFARAQNCSASLLSTGAREALRVLRPRIARPANAYARFFAEQYPVLRAQSPESSGVPEIGRRAGALWRAMDAEAREKYAAAARADRDAYVSAREARDSSANETEVIADFALRFDARYRSGTMMRRQIPAEVREFAQKLPDAPPATGRALFMSEQMRGRADAVAIMSQVSEAWAALPAGEKAAYAQRAAAGVAQYRQQLSAILSDNQFEYRIVS